LQIEEAKAKGKVNEQDKQIDQILLQIEEAKLEA